MKHFHVCFMLSLLSIPYFNLYSMEPSTSSEPVTSSSLMQVSTNSSHQQSIRRASNAVHNFVHSVTPRAGTPQASEDIFGSSTNPLVTSDAIRRPSGPIISLDLQSPTRSQIRSDHIPSAAAEGTSTPENVRTLSDSTRQNHQASIRRASIAIQALRALSAKPQASQAAAASSQATSDGDTLIQQQRIAAVQSPEGQQHTQSVLSSSLSSQILEVAEPAALATAAAYAGFRLARATPQKRFIDPVTAGTALSLVSSAGSFLTSGAVPVIVAAVGAYKLNGLIHAGCVLKEERLADDFKKQLDAHKAETNSRLDGYAAQVGGVLQEVGAALEDTGNSLEQVANIVEKIAPAGDLTAIKAIHEQAERLKSVGQKTEHSPQLPPQKEKACCSSCCVIA